MALDRTSFRYAPLWGKRMVEWGILAIVILILSGIFGHYAHQVQGQSERASVLSTLGALRTALVLGQIHQMVELQQRNDVKASDNPFDALERTPTNYDGVVHSRDFAAIRPGNWVFDPECPCIGFKPTDPEWLESPPGAQILWYSVVRESKLRQLRPMAVYQWLGLDVR